jgi:hypothetical protein
MPAVGLVSHAHTWVAVESRTDISTCCFLTPHIQLVSICADSAHLLLVTLLLLLLLLLAGLFLQGPVTWSWPQQQLYAPATAPALPSIICCTWDEPVHAQQATAAAVQHAAADAAAGAPKAKATRRRLTSTSSAAAAAAAVAREASSQPQQQQQQQAAEAVALQPRLAVLHISDQLPGPQVLAALQPLLQDAGRSNVLFESKRCHTELRHWGLQLAGEHTSEAAAAC